MLITSKNPTPEEIRQQYKDRFKQNISAQMTSMYSPLVSGFNKLFNQIWSNDTITPQEAFELIGTDSVALFQIAGAFQQAINTAVPNSLNLTPPVSLTFNGDGTVSFPTE